MASLQALDVWLISCAGADDKDAYTILDAAERGRAGRFVFPEHRCRFVRAHAALRQILHRYTGASPGDLRFGVGEHGKPFLEHPAADSLSFNLSHSGDLAVVAVGEMREVGVDIECIRHVPDWDEIARRSFHPAESEWVRSYSEDRRAEAFFEVWTKKEAYIKACGHGLSHPLDSFQVVGPLAQQEYVIAALQLPAGYAGAVGYTPPECEVRLSWWHRA